jgi:hypothetical protein
MMEESGGLGDGLGAETPDALNLVRIREIGQKIHDTAVASEIELENLTRTLKLMREARRCMFRNTRVRTSVICQTEELNLGTLVGAYNEYEYRAMIADYKKFTQFEKIYLAFFRNISPEECRTEKPWAVIEV